MTTLTQLLLDETRQRREALRDYRNICRRFDDPQPEDASRVRECCVLLQLSLDDLERDAAAWSSIGEHVERARHAPDLDKRRLELEQEVQAKQRAAKERAAQDEREIADLRRKQRTIIHQLEIARAAQTRVDALHRSAWRVFGSPAPLPTGNDAPHPATIDAWLAPRPDELEFPHDGDGGIVRRLRESGYRPGRPGVWWQYTESKPKTRKKKSGAGK